jgi:putative ABC transport system permease protein
MSTLWQDLRLAARAIKNNPGFSAVVVIALGLGLSVNLGVFDIVSGLLLRPLPVARPHELASVFLAPRDVP